MSVLLTGNDLTFAQLYANLTSDSASNAWSKFQAAVETLPNGVSSDDPFYNSDPANIDISVKPSDRALIGKWTDDALAQGMIKKKVDLDTLFQN